MPICKALTNHICFSVEGHYKPCCTYRYLRPEYRVADFTPNEFLSTEYMQTIKRNMEGDNWDPGCEVCKKNEDSKGVSQRMIYNHLMKEPAGTLEFLDYTTGNQCNLSCRMCFPEVSSKWAKLLGVNYNNKNNFTTAISSFDTSKLNRISYIGGEPFITGEANQVLDYAAENNLIFHFFTNLTYWPEKFLPKLKKCKKVFATYSIDGIGKLNDYIRHPSEWAIVEENLHRWLDFFSNEIENGSQSISVTLQAYNFHQIAEIKNYFKNLNITPTLIQLDRPNYFQFDALPPEYIKNHTTDESKKYVETYKFNYPLFCKLKSYTKEMDQLLGRKLEDYLPDLANILEQAI